MAAPRASGSGLEGEAGGKDGASNKAGGRLGLPKHRRLLLRLHRASTTPNPVPPPSSIRRVACHPPRARPSWEGKERRATP